MAVPSDFEPGKVAFETDGHSGEANEGEEAEFSFGPYRVVDVSRGVTFREGFEDFENFGPAKERGYLFKVSGGGKRELAGRCAERAPKVEKALDGSETVIEEEPPLGCTCQAGKALVVKLFIEDLAGEYNGPLVVGDIEARVVGDYNLENGELRRGRPLGYRIDDNEGTVAAADVGEGESRVWFRKGLEEPGRQQLACALAGLMLWVPPPAHQPEQ